MTQHDPQKHTDDSDQTQIWYITTRYKHKDKRERNHMITTSWIVDRSMFLLFKNSVVVSCDTISDAFI